MPQFSVFFSDGDGFGIEMVYALVAAHALEIVRTQHPTGRLSAVPAELLDVKERHKRLVALLRVEWLAGWGGSKAAINPASGSRPTTAEPWHDRQGKHGKALKLFWVHSPHFVRAAHRTATSRCGRG
ncbi:hypothetical protein KBY83_00010 [Cyanobium sp. WKJ7-Wakatipu]|uniref:hypothetical protein n=1 Tax=Cyanobium sp. WKJ7-Wakatipu TaxID=2823726 RepID=UPI0020CDD8E0|nr:hypothetical protein [Cyanobium sp. WKJ7-Wakatipu]MCP9781699.1 hypothetical protein [Cyanobium sp. WKJ7-Wakatipu]